MTSIDNQPAGKREAAADRRVKALELRMRGEPYRAIGETLGVSEAQAHRDVHTALAALAKREQVLAEAHRAMEDARLDVALVGLWPKVAKGDVDAINAWVRVSESRRRLYGLDLQPGTLLPGNVEIILRWHGDNNRIIDITPDGDHAAAPASLTDGRGDASGAVQGAGSGPALGEVTACLSVMPDHGAE